MLEKKPIKKKIIHKSSPRRKSGSPAAKKSSKIKLIFNPRSGSGLILPLFSNLLFPDKKKRLFKITRPGEHLRKILKQLQVHGIDPEPATIMSPAAATAMARYCARENYALVIVAGGDGTINAVANGLAGSQTAMGVIPTGTANIFGLQMKIPADLPGACQRIAQGRQITIDLGKVDNRYFTCWTGVGFDAFVIKQTDWKLKKIIGALAYLVAGVASLFVYPFRHVHFRIDGQAPIQRGYLLIIGNIKYYGGNTVLLPHANMQDGLLDVCVFKKRGFFSFLAYFWGLRLGALGKFLDVEYSQCRKIEVLDRKQHVQIDGDYFGRMPLKIKVVARALKVVV